MASSAAVVPPPQPKPSNIDDDDDDEDSEYEEIEEEIEVEEEFEEEIEVDEDEDDEEEEVEVEEEVDEEDALVADTAGEGEIGEELTPLRDDNQVIDMDLEDPDEHLQNGSMTQGIYVSNPLSEIPTTQEDVGPVKTSESREKEELPVNGERTSGLDDPKSPFCGSRNVNHAERTHLVGEDYHGALIMDDASRVKDISGEINHNDVEALADIRSHVSQVRFREPSSNVAFDRENKKMRIICEFHAKGWCIKGSSCRFLHVKDVLDAVVNKNESSERQASSSGFVLPHQSEENPNSNCETDKLLAPMDDTLGGFPLDGGRGSFGHNLYKNNHRYPYGNFSSPGTSHDNHHISRLSAFGTTSDEMFNKKNGIVPTDLRSADLPYSLSRRPLSLGSSSWSTDAVGKRNLPKSDLDCHASVSPSLKRNISPAPCSESESLLRNRVYKDSGLDCHASVSPSLKRNISPAPCSESESLLRNRVYKNKQSDIKSNNKLSSDDWEPSVPFRPSHAIIRNLLMKENLYDHIRDIEQTGDKDGKVKFSHSDQGSSIKNVDNVQSNSSPEEERLLDTVKDNKLSTSCDDKLRFEEQRPHKKVVKVNGSGKHEETDGHTLNESKALKYFQAKLIEFVKELVRPTWHEGLLSREAHKVIVKKAVDKVISTLQPQQIPCTDESIKSYLSSSVPKLEKLVEAYIDKYGKT